MGNLFIYLNALLVILLAGYLLGLLVYLLTRLFGERLTRALERTSPELVQRIRRTFPAEINIETIRALSWLILLLAVILLLAFLGSQVIFYLVPSGQPARNGYDIGTDPFLIAPIAAVIVSTFLGAIFIQNIFEIRFRDALYYTLVSVFRVMMPRVIIDHGRVYIRRFGRNIEVMPAHSNRPPSAAADDIINERYNTIMHIGGPGLMIVQPGNACVTNNLRGPAQVGLIRSVELLRFERIGYIAELDDQHGNAQNIEAITRDGIRIICPEVNFRYRILFERGQQRTIDNPFPFQDIALQRMTYNLPVDDSGNRRDLPEQARTAVTTALRNFINRHTVDYLTAPRQGSRNVRAEIRSSILNDVRTFMLGVQIIMIDVGHIQVADAVTEIRYNEWAVNWIGEAQRQRAYAAGTQMGLEEQGRAQAQADMIGAIINGLKSANVATDDQNTVRNIFLTRTAMILDAMRANQQQFPARNLITAPRRNP